MSPSLWRDICIPSWSVVCYVSQSYYASLSCYVSLLSGPSLGQSYVSLLSGPSLGQSYASLLSSLGQSYVSLLSDPSLGSVIC